MTPGPERLYRAGVWIKGVNGAVELIGGALVALIPRATVLQIIATLTQHDLGRDSVDAVYGLLARAFTTIGVDERGFAVFYLLSHGVLKIFIAVCLLRAWRHLVPAAIAVFAALIVYEVYRLLTQPDILIAAVVVVDVAIFSLVLRHALEPARGT